MLFSYIWYPWIHVFLCINLNFWQILKYTNFVWTEKKTSVTARNEKDPRSRLESPRKTYFEGLTFNREAAILTIWWHSSVEQVCHQLLTVTDRFIFATAYPHPLRYGSTHKPTLDFLWDQIQCLSMFSMGFRCITQWSKLSIWVDLVPSIQFNMFENFFLSEKSSLN